MYTCQGNQQMEKMQTTISNILMTYNMRLFIMIFKHCDTMIYNFATDTLE